MALPTPELSSMRNGISMGSSFVSSYSADKATWSLVAKSRLGERAIRGSAAATRRRRVGCRLASGVAGIPHSDSDTIHDADVLFSASSLSGDRARLHDELTARYDHARCRPTAVVVPAAGRHACAEREPATKRWRFSKLRCRPTTATVADQRFRAKSQVAPAPRPMANWSHVSVRRHATTTRHRGDALREILRSAEDCTQAPSRRTRQ